METSIYRYILRHTKRDQMLLLALSLLSLPVIYVSLEVPKKIINEALSSSLEFYTIAGFEVDQIQYLLILCFAYLGMVMLNGGIKYTINVYQGVVGERLLRRFRYELYQRILRFPLPHFKKTSQGEIIPMVVAETEPLGEFIGESFTIPALQGGTLLTYLSFIFVQDVVLGLAAVSMYPLQMVVIPRLQKKVNELSKARVATVRRFSERIGESVSGVTEIHAHDSSRFFRAVVGGILGRIFEIRFQIYKKKYFIKFLNNFLDAVGPFFFYSMGGYFVIKGELSIGALVASLSAYKDISAPWKALLKYYQKKEDIKVKYNQIIEQFQPEGMLEPRVLDEDPEEVPAFSGDLITTNMGYSEDGSTLLVEGVNTHLKTDGRTVVVGAGGSGKTELGMLVGKLLTPTSGRIRLGETSLADIPESQWARYVAYVGADTFVFQGTVRDNLYYGLKHRPEQEAEYDDEQRTARNRDLKSAIASGNSVHDAAAYWIDHKEAGVSSAEELEQRALQCVAQVGMAEDVYQFGLRGQIEVSKHEALTGRLLEARKTIRERLCEPDMEGLVETFERSTYNASMSVAENLLFGVSSDPSFQPEDLVNNTEIQEILTKTGVLKDLVEAGHKVAKTMVELFSDVDPDSEMFEQFSFISAEDLPEFRDLLSRIESGGLDAVEDDDRSRLISLSFMLVPARHRLGIIDERMRASLLETRRALITHWAETGSPVEVFDREKYHSGISIQDNILFGRLVYGQARAHTAVGELIDSVISEMSLKEEIVRSGLEYEVGVNGSRLTTAQRQRLGIARCLIKNPKLLITNQAASVLDAADEQDLLDKILSERAGEGLLWVTDRTQLASRFDHVMVMEGGKLHAEGTYDDVKSSSEFERLASSG